MNTAIDRFLSLPQAYIHLECILTLPNQPTCPPITLANVIGLHIDQNFGAKYADDIILTFDASVDLYMTILKNFKDLSVLVNLYPIGVGESTKQATPMFSCSYKALVMNKEDLDKIYPQGVLVASTDAGMTEQHMSNSKRMSLNLVTEKLYVARKRVFNAILTNCTMADALYFVVGCLNYTDVFIVPPDNKKVYKNLVIPPLSKLSDFVSYFQDAPGLGLYKIPANCYVTNDRIYIYPSELVDPITIKTLHIYMSGNKSFPNLSRYHYVNPVTGDVHILAGSGDSVNTDSSDMYIENMGNSILLHNSNSIFDTAAELTSVGMLLQPTKISSVINMITPSGMVTDTRTLSFGYSANNEFHYMAKHALGDCITLGIVWPGSIPFGLHPGSKVIIYYDTLDGFTSKNGLLGQVYTDVEQTGTRTTTRQYVSNSKLVIYMAPDVPQEPVKPAALLNLV